MHPFFKGPAGAMVLTVAACGSPGGLDQDRFPDLSETGYDDVDGTTLGGAGVNGGSGSVGGGGVAGDLSSPPGGGANGGGESGSPGGSDDIGSGATDGTGVGGDSDALDLPDTAAGGGGGCLPVEDLFSRPASEGGCTGGCHEGGMIAPDLTSPGVGERLLNLQSMCDGRPYIGADDSFLAEKISGSPQCGFEMPYLMAGSLSETDRECILQWVTRVATGGG